jgi:maleylpyruvate isomerase
MSDSMLYGYWRSTAAYRVRIAANLKGLALQHVFVHLREGAQRKPDFLARNPAGLVPLWTEGDFSLAQSLAIIEYLDETHPEPPLLPGDARRRAITREIALTIVADVHPIGNLRVLDKISADFGADAPARAAWNRHWMAIGLAAVETRLRQSAGRFAVGDDVSLADVCLTPQLYNARRFDLDLASFPTILRVEGAAQTLPAFAAATPEQQSDSE